MKNSLKITLIAYLIFIVLLVVALLIVLRQFSQYESLPETMQMVDFSGMLLTVLAAAIFMLISIALTFLLARSWALDQPELGESIIRLAMIVSIALIVVFGGLSGGFIVLRTLWTIGYF